ncbi:hypothetical protein GE21DRAFT_1291317 [Neurospora crassa]|nr:hypothetical protein GE21DRAFT_1291317 [Neurospora crassa]
MHRQCHERNGIVSAYDQRIRYQAVSAFSVTSVAWVAECLILPLLTDHFEAEEANREGFTCTIHKMQYYSALEPLVPLHI